MGSVHAYSSKKGKRYRVVYRRPDNSQGQKRGFTTKRDADLYLARVETAKATGDYVNPSDAKVTVSQLAAEWLENRQPVLKPSTYRVIVSAWERHVEPKWGDRPVGGLKPSEIQSWVSAKSTTLSATSVLRIHGVLASVLDDAVRDRRLTRNPARGMQLPTKQRKARAYLSHRQVALLAEQSQHATLVYTLAYTGLRWGEATGLRVRHVDFERRRLSVEENAVMVNGHIVVGTPKTHRNRSVPFPAFLGGMLNELCQQRRPEELVFGDGNTHLKLPNSKAGWFFGAVARARRIDSTFPVITPHDLRHTVASLAISAGANVKAVQRMLGHASAAMTLDTYTDLFDDDLDRVSQALDHARSDVNRRIARPRRQGEIPSLGRERSRSYPDLDM
tara:strand:- start:2512 stop:3681 length:1170 start_codon:yes stop_codon:yes gene_type:complete